MLKIVVEDQDMREIYEPHVRKHNDEIANISHPNAGFDLFIPETHTIPATIQTYKINHKLKAEMTMNNEPTGFFLMPRSSFSGTPLMLANHVGVVDSGYRGDLIAAVRNLGESTFVAERGIRLMQICHPTLKPFRVEIVGSVNDLSSTARGEGGFGSTGR